MKDSSRHVILGVQQFKPAEFGAQINLSMDNAWGIVRCIVDLVRKQKDGKYLIVKDPMKPVIRLYDIPDSTFESEDESDDEDEGKGLLLWEKITHSIMVAFPQCQCKKKGASVSYCIAFVKSIN